MKIVTCFDIVKTRRAMNGEHGLWSFENRLCLCTTYLNMCKVLTLI